MYKRNIQKVKEVTTATFTHSDLLHFITVRLVSPSISINFCVCESDCGWSGGLISLMPTHTHTRVHTPQEQRNVFCLSGLWQNDVIFFLSQPWFGCTRSLFMWVEPSSGVVLDNYYVIGQECWALCSGTSQEFRTWVSWEVWNVLTRTNLFWFCHLEKRKKKPNISLFLQSMSTPWRPLKMNPGKWFAPFLLRCSNWTRLVCFF